MIERPRQDERMHHAKRANLDGRAGGEQDVAWWLIIRLGHSQKDGEEDGQGNQAAVLRTHGGLRRGVAHGRGVREWMSTRVT